jgi:serine/threonine protein phosphatase PrpC
MLTNLYEGGWAPARYQLPFGRGPPVVLLDRELAESLLGERWRDLASRLIAFGWQHPVYAPTGVIVMITQTWAELTQPGAVTPRWWQNPADHEVRHLRDGRDHAGHAADEAWLVNGLPATVRTSRAAIGQATGSASAPSSTSVTPAARRPTVTDPKLREIVDPLYRGVDEPDGTRTGSGTTADALRFETRTGKPVKGHFHSRKAEAAIDGLTKWGRNNPAASAADRAVAHHELNDLRDALGLPGTRLPDGVAEQVKKAFGQANQKLGPSEFPTLTDLASKVSQRVGRAVSPEELARILADNPQLKLVARDGVVLPRAFAARSAKASGDDPTNTSGRGGAAAIGGTTPATERAFREMLTNLYEGGWQPAQYQLPFGRGPPVVLLGRELAESLLGERWGDLASRLIAFGWQHPRYAPAGVIVMITQTWDDLTSPGAVTPEWWQDLADHEVRHLNEGWDHSGHAADEAALVNGLPEGVRRTRSPTRAPADEFPARPSESMGAGSGGQGGGSPPASAGDGGRGQGDGSHDVRVNTGPAVAKRVWSPAQARAPPTGNGLAREPLTLEQRATIEAWLDDPVRVFSSVKEWNTRRPSGPPMPSAPGGRVRVVVSGAELPVSGVLAYGWPGGDDRPSVVLGPSIAARLSYARDREQMHDWWSQALRHLWRSATGRGAEDGATALVSGWWALIAPAVPRNARADSGWLRAPTATTQNMWRAPKPAVDVFSWSAMEHLVGRLPVAREVPAGDAELAGLFTGGGARGLRVVSGLIAGAVALGVTIGGPVWASGDGWHYVDATTTSERRRRTSAPSRRDPAVAAFVAVTDAYGRAVWQAPELGGEAPKTVSRVVRIEVRLAEGGLSSGSGFIWSAAEGAALVVTNRHVVAGAAQVRVEVSRPGGLTTVTGHVLPRPEQRELAIQLMLAGLVTSSEPDAQARQRTAWDAAGEFDLALVRIPESRTLAPLELDRTGSERRVITLGFPNTQIPAARADDDRGLNPTYARELVVSAGITTAAPEVNWGQPRVLLELYHVGDAWNTEGGSGGPVITRTVTADGGYTERVRGVTYRSQPGYLAAMHAGALEAFLRASNSDPAGSGGAAAIGGTTPAAEQAFREMLTSLYDGGWAPAEYQLPFGRGPPVVLLDRELAESLLGERWRDLGSRLIAFGWQHPVYAPDGVIVMIIQTWDELTQPGAVTPEWWQDLADHEMRHLTEGWDHAGHAADETRLVAGLPQSLRTDRGPADELSARPSESIGSAGQTASGRPATRTGLVARVLSRLARTVGAVLIGLGVVWGATPGVAVAVEPVAVTQSVVGSVTAQTAVPGAHSVLIEPGDSVSRVAAATGLRPQDILAVNPRVAAHPNLIRAGDRLILPANWDGVWRVRPGDTLSEIALRLDPPASVGELARASGVADPDRIRPGQRIVLAPGQLPANPPAAPNPGGPPSLPHLPSLPHPGAPAAPHTGTRTPTPGPVAPVAPGPVPGPDWITSVGGVLLVLAALLAKPLLAVLRGGLGRLGNGLRTVGGWLGGAVRTLGGRVGDGWRATTGWVGGGLGTGLGTLVGGWRATAAWLGRAAAGTAGFGRRVGGRVSRVARERYCAAAGIGLGLGGGVVVGLGGFGQAGVIAGGVVVAVGGVAFAVGLWSARMARGPPAVVLAAAAAVLSAGFGIGAAVWGGPVGSWVGVVVPLAVWTTVLSSLPSALLTYRYVLRRQVNNLLGGLERNPRGDALRSAVLAFTISATYGLWGHAGVTGSVVVGVLVAIASSAVQRKDTGRTRRVKALVAGLMVGPVAWLGGQLGGVFTPELGEWVAGTLGAMAAVVGSTAIADYVAAGWLNWLDKREKRHPKSDQLTPRAHRWVGAGGPGGVLGGVLDRVLGAPRGVGLERRSTPDSQVLVWKSVDPILAALLSWVIKGSPAHGASTVGELASRVGVAAAILAVSWVVRDWKEFRRKILGYSGARKLLNPRRIGQLMALLLSGRGRLGARLARFDQLVKPLLERRGPLPRTPAEWATALTGLTDELASVLATATTAPTPWWESFVRANSGVVPTQLLATYYRLADQRAKQHPVAIAHAIATLVLYDELLRARAARLRDDGRVEDAGLIEFAADLVARLAAHPRLVALATPQGVTPAQWARRVAVATAAQRVRLVNTELARQLDQRNALRADLMKLEKSILRAIMANYPTSGRQASEQGPLARARQELLVLRVGLVREGARGKHVGKDGAGKPGMADHIDALSAVAELFDQRGRSVRDSATPRAPLREALGLMEGLADLAGEVNLSRFGRGATRQGWAGGIDAALSAPATRPDTPLWALWRVIGRDGSFTAAALSAQFDGRHHRLAWWIDTLAAWQRLGALTRHSDGTYRVNPDLRKLWIAAGPRVRAGARANVTALPGGAALGPLTGDRFEASDPVTAGAYAELIRLLDAGASARRWWRDGWVDDIRATLIKWGDTTRSWAGPRTGRVDAYPDPQGPGLPTRAGRAVREVGATAWERWSTARQYRGQLNRLVNLAWAATRERRRLVAGLPEGSIAPEQLSEVLRASQLEADAYAGLARGYVAAATALGKDHAEVYPHVVERILRRAKATLDSGPGSDPTKLSVARRLHEVGTQLRTALRALTPASGWPSTEDRDNALRAAALALERVQLAQDDAYRVKLYQTVGGWQRMEATRRATDALWLVYQRELAQRGPPSSPSVPAHSRVIPPVAEHIDEASTTAAGAAAFTRRGRGHEGNQDAAALAGDPTRTDAVLGDGLSNTPGSRQASRTGVEAGLAALSDHAGDDPITAIRRAYRAAALMVTAGRVGASTWLAARVIRDHAGGARLVFGWVGDSRVYWLPAPGSAGAPELLSTDHAVIYNPFGARADTDALTRWLAPFYRPELQIATTQITGPGLIVLVTDGVWNTLRDPATLATTLSATAYTDPTRAAAELADAARELDPDDDATAIVIQIGARTPTGPAATVPASTNS